MRLIDADALFLPDENSDRILVFVPRNGKNAALAMALLRKKVDDAPTIEAKPVKHGRWAYHPQTYETVFCSKCGGGHDEFTNYCPNCGAKMDLDG